MPIPRGVRATGGRVLTASRALPFEAVAARRALRSGGITFDELLGLEDLNETYAIAHAYYRWHLPAALREHRKYFRAHGRGFGEDAFHAMWWLLMRDLRPRRMLEIGVYRGQTLSLWALAARKLGVAVEVHGVTPLTAAGDAVSIYYGGIDYALDINHNFGRFGLPVPVLTKAFSTEDAAVAVTAATNSWDVVYIDGSHEEDVVLADYRNARAGLAPGGIIVLDDASLHLPYRPPRGVATAGHPGPSNVVRDVARREMQLVGAVGHNVVFRERPCPLPSP